jgi:hypothetical protein
MWSAAQPPTTTEVAEAFAIDVGELRPHEGGFEADAFSDGRWFVKLWRHGMPDERVLALTPVLADRGLPVPAAVRAVDGGYTAEHDGKRYAVFPYVPGRNATWEHQAEIAAVMRELHAIRDLDLPRLDWEGGVETYGPMLRELLDHPWLASYRDEVEGHVDRMDDALARAKTIDGPQVVCHFDMQPHNVLVDDDGRLVAVVDWCWGETAPREHDLFVAFCGPDPVRFLREYGAEGIELTHLEFMLLERSIRYATGRVQHEVEREFVDEQAFDWCRRIDAMLDMARPFT